MQRESNDNRPLVYLGMPNTGGMSNGAALGLFAASMASPNRLNVRVSVEASSLLALNHNKIWCWALNAAHKGEPIRYVAYQHSDIEPQIGWLETAIDELEANQLDVLGVVAPIKDSRGVTSIAVARDDGDPWRVHARLTMREIFRLPPTFTSEDVGRPLLLNTGLWVARWGDWCRKVHFTINDEIVFNETLDRYHPQCESEDWFFSRLCHELGLRIGCTRKIRIAHKGDMLFTNDHPWGTEEFDTANATESVIPDPLPEVCFPAEVAGWLTKAEGRELARIARGKTVLEIGSYCGRSTVCLAQLAKKVVAVDTFDGRATPQPGNTLEIFRRTLQRHGVADRVSVCPGDSVEVLADLPQVFDLVFIDGDHGPAGVARDITAARQVLRPGGLLAFHDYGSAHPAVTAAVDGLVASGGEIVGRVDSLAVVRPPAAVPQPLEA